MNAQNNSCSYHWNNGSNLQVVNVHLPGIYAVTVTNIQGCSASDTCELFILPLNQAVKNLSVCQGDSILVAGHYYHTAGTYHDTVASSGGCDTVLTNKYKFIKYLSNIEQLCYLHGRQFVD